MTNKNSDKTTVTDGDTWNSSKEMLIREIRSTNEAIQNFADPVLFEKGQLEAMDETELSKELKTISVKLNQLVNEWDVK